MSVAVTDNKYCIHVFGRILGGERSKLIAIYVEKFTAHELRNLENFAAENCGPYFIYLCLKYSARLFAGLLLCMEWNVLRSCSLDVFSMLARLILLYQHLRQLLSKCFVPQNFVNTCCMCWPPLAFSLFR